MAELKVGELRQLAEVVADAVHLNDVRLADVTCKGTSPLLAGPFDVTSEIMVSGMSTDEGLQVSARYDVTSVSEATDERPEAWRVNLRINAEFHWDHDAREDPPSFSTDESRAFGLLVGVVAIHPYARETIQSLSGRMSYPPFSLELIESLVVASEDTVFSVGSSDDEDD